MKEEILKKLLEYLQNTELFLSGQIPDVFRQIMQIELFKIWALFIFSIICLIAFGISLYFFLKEWEEKEYENLLVLIGLFVGGICGIICLTVSLYKLYLFYYAPKVFLIEYIGGLLK